jgi:hypothetical protein
VKEIVILDGVLPRRTLRDEVLDLQGRQLTPRLIMRIRELRRRAVESGEIREPFFARAFELVMQDVQTAEALAEIEAERSRALNDAALRAMILWRAGRV